MEGLTLFRAIFTVVAVLLLAYYCSRLLGKQGVKASGSAHLKVIECIQVGQDRRILLLKVGDHHYLVGVSQAGVQLLAEVEGDFKVQPPVDNAQELPSFQKLLNKMMPPGKSRDQIKEEEDE